MLVSRESPSSNFHANCMPKTLNERAGIGSTSLKRQRRTFAGASGLCCQIMPGHSATDCGLLLERLQIDLTEENLGALRLKEELAFGVAGVGGGVDGDPVEDVVVRI